MRAITGFGMLKERRSERSVSLRACIIVAMTVTILASPLQTGGSAAAAQTTPSSPASMPSSFPAIDPAAPTSKPPPEVEVPVPDVAAVGKPSVPPAPKPGEELLDRRTVNSKTFTTDKPGELRTELYEAPVHFKDPQGRWLAIDDTLGASKDGRRRNAANVFDLSLADSSTDKAVARLAVDDKHSVGFALDGAAEVKAKGDTHSVTYFKVRKDTDMRLTSRRGGVKDELVLASPAAPDRFVFPLELKGLTASLDEAGNVIYRDEAGVERARTPHGFMTDANIDPRSGEAPMSLGVTYALIPWNGGTALEVRLDRAWLDDPARQYPVTVDPEIHNAAWGDDTYVMSGFYRDNSYDAELKVGTYDGGAHIGRAFMHFDSGAITNTTVTHAELHLAERHSWNCNYQPEPVWRVGAGWNGRGIPDWSQQPPTDANAIAGGTFANAGCSNRLAVWNVTSAAATWAANPGANFGLSLRATNEYDNNRWKKYASTEAGAPPALHVWYNRPPAVPYNVTPVNGSVLGTPSTPVSAVYSDPDGNSGYLAFGVWNYQNQLVWSQWSGLLCSGCGTTLAVPALPDNWYYVMVIGHDGAQYSSAWSAQQWYFIDTLPPAASELTPLNGASGSSPTQVSARYSEPYGFTGYMYFWLYTTGGVRIVENWSAVTNSGSVASLAIPNLAPGTYNLWAMPWDTRQTGPQIGPNTFTVGVPPTTTTVAPTTTTTVPATTTTVPATTTTVPATTTTVPATTTTTSSSTTSSTTSTSSTSTSTTSTTVPASVPGAPQIVSVKAGNESATVAWTQPPANGSPITYFRVTPVRVADGTAEASITTANGSITTATIGSLNNGERYIFRVVAHNVVGDSEPGTSAAVTPPGGFRTMTWNLALGAFQPDMAVLATVILGHGVDIAAIQEISESAPQALLAELTERDPGGRTWQMAYDDNRVIYSRNTLTNVGAWQFANDGVRGFQRTVVTEPDLGETAYIYNVHLTASPASNRGAQAQEVLDQVLLDRQAAGSGFRAIVLGDFNEDIGAAMDAFAGAGFVNAWLELGQASGAERNPDGSYTQAAKDAHTFVGLNNRGRIDHVLVGTHGGGLRDLSIDAAEVDVDAGPLDDGTGGYSDHRPVIVQLSAP